MKALAYLFLLALTFALSIIIYTHGLGLEIKSWPAIIICWLGLVGINIVTKALE